MNLSFANPNGRPGHFVGAFSGARFMASLANATFAERAMRLFERSACERRILCGNYLMFAASLFEEAAGLDDGGAWMEGADATVFDADEEAFRGARETRQQLVDELVQEVAEATECPHCRKRAVVCLAARQLRSADEPEHYAKRCMACGRNSH